MNKKSGHWTNTGMAKFINDNLYNYKSDDEKSMNPFRWYRLQNGDDVSKYRETINGFPCRLILVNDGETPLNTGQNEPTPGNTKDMGIFNFNNDKDNVTTLGFNSDIFPNCASYEVTANSDTSAGAFMSFKYEGKFGLEGTADINIYQAGQRYYTPYLSIGLFADVTDIVNNVECIVYWYDENYVSKGSQYLSPNTKFNITTIKDIAKYIQISTYVSQGASSFIVNNVNITGTIKEQGDWIYNNITIIPSVVDEKAELAYLKESFELRHPDADDVAEDWGFMGVEEEILKIDEYLYYGSIKTSTMEANYFNSDSVTITFDNNASFSFTPTGTNVSPQYGVRSGTTISLEGVDRFNLAVNDWTYVDINENRYYKGIMHDVNLSTKDENPYKSTIFNTSYGLKALIDWVDNCTDEEFVRDFEQHFHKDYTLRYFCLVTLIGAVDRKNCPL